MILRPTKCLGQSLAGARCCRSDAKRTRPAANSRQPRGYLRHLAFEPLEKRSLLSVVTLNITVEIANLTVNGSAVGGTVPVIGADVQVVGSQSGSVIQSESGTPTTNSSGSCTLKFSDSALPDGTSIYIDVYTRSTSKALYNTTYELDGYKPTGTELGQGHQTGPYKFRQFEIVQNATEKWGLVINEYSDDQKLARAFAVFSALALPLNFATSLDATLPAKFTVDYPNDTDLSGSGQPLSYFDGSGELSGQSWPTLDYTTNVLDHPYTVAHEFGHMVAASNGFTNLQASYPEHQLGSNFRGTSDNGAASQDNLDSAFAEGWADYFMVATSDFEKSDTLHIPGFGPNQVSLPSGAGFGEDDELSVAETFLDLDEYGINANRTNPNEARIPPYSADCLFAMLKGSKIHDLAQFYQSLDAGYANLDDSNQYYATIGALSQAVGISSVPGTLTAGANGTFGINVGLVMAYNAKTGAITKLDTTTFQPAAIQVEVFNDAWVPICILGTGEENRWATLPYFHSTVTVSPSGDVSPAPGSVSISPQAWSAISNGNAAYWVVEYMSYSGNASPFYFWSGPKILKLPPINAQGKPVSATDGSPFSGEVANFTNPGDPQDASAYAATIFWGDGAQTMVTSTLTADGQIVQIDPSDPSQGFEVLGNHTYDAAGDDAVRVDISDNSGDNTMVDAEAQVAAAAISINITSGLQFTKGARDTYLDQPVATFTDAGGAQPSSNYVAAINWGGVPEVSGRNPRRIVRDALLAMSA